jgi:hypothetical protein
MDYDQTDPPRLPRDFKADVTRGRYTYYFNPKTSAFVGYRYIKKDLDQESDTFFDYEMHNPKFGFSHSLYENVSLTAAAGYLLRKVDNKDDEQDFYGQLNFTGQYKQLTATVYGERGFFDDYTSADSLGFYKFWRTGLDARYQLFERFRVEGFFYFERDKFVDIGRTDKYYNVRGRLTYQPLKWAYFSLDYQYNKRDSTSPFESYTNNRIFFQITFQHDIAERFQ